MTAIAFLGMGAMGSRMAAHLLASGHTLTIWNRSASATERLASQGAGVAPTPAAAVKGAEVVISMVRDDAASRDVWLHREYGALNAMAPNTLAIESSTLTPGWVIELASHCQNQSVAFADAPVAGSRPQAEAAKLIYFVGANGETFARVQNTLAHMGSAVHHCGPVGSGAAIKLAVNALLGVQLASLAELMGFLRKAGLDLQQQALSIITSTPVCSPAVSIASQAMLNRQFAPAFPITLAEKDFSYIAFCADEVQAQVPVAVATQQVLRAAIEQGFGDDNITGVLQLYLDKPL